MKFVAALAAALTGYVLGGLLAVLGIALFATKHQMGEIDL